MKKCVVLEMENKTDFENAMNDYLSDGYKVEASHVIVNIIKLF